MKELSLGIQLYTVREACQQDFTGTLTALAEMGYQGVEFAWNYGGMSPEELAAFLKGIGLVTAGMHISLEEISNPDSESYRYVKALQCPFVTTSLANKVATEWLDIIPKVNEAGKVALSQGATFTYHNHAQEFTRIDGAYALDLLYAQTDPQAVQAELDTYWIAKGGEEVVPYLRKYAGRVPQVHLKDMDPTDGSFAEVGTGIMDVPAIFAAAREIGSRWVIVEQDACKRPVLESARISADNIKKAGVL